MYILEKLRYLRYQYNTIRYDTIGYDTIPLSPVSLQEENIRAQELVCDEGLSELSSRIKIIRHFKKKLYYRHPAYIWGDYLGGGFWGPWQD